MHTRWLKWLVLCFKCCKTEHTNGMNLIIAQAKWNWITCVQFQGNCLVSRIITFMDLTRRKWFLHLLPNPWVTKLAGIVCKSCHAKSNIICCPISSFGIGEPEFLADRNYSKQICWAVIVSIGENIFRARSKFGWNRFSIQTRASGNGPENVHGLLYTSAPKKIVTVLVKKLWGKHQWSSSSQEG